MRFELGRYTETHNEQSARRIAHRAAIDGRNLQQNKNSFLFFALANRNAKAGVNPDPGTD
jgi:hypothetical protein